MSEHQLVGAEQLSAGRYRAGCSCGYATGVYANANAAERWAAHHLKGTRGELFKLNPNLGEKWPATGGLDG